MKLTNSILFWPSNANLIKKMCPAGNFLSTQIIRVIAGVETQSYELLPNPRPLVTQRTVLDGVHFDWIWGVTPKIPLGDLSILLFKLILGITISTWTENTFIWFNTVFPDPGNMIPLEMYQVIWWINVSRSLLISKMKHKIGIFILIFTNNDKHHSIIALI